MPPALFFLLRIALAIQSFVVPYTFCRDSQVTQWLKICLPIRRLRFNPWASKIPWRIVSDSLQPHGPQHPRPHCPSSTPGVHPNSCPSSVMPSNHLILCCPLLPLPSIFPSIRVFSNESTLHIRWPKYWGFSFSIRPSNEYSGLMSCEIHNLTQP